MFAQTISKGLLLSAAVLTLGAALAEAQPNPAGGTIAAAAAQLAGRADGVAASSARLDVLPMKMAGSCPRSFMLKVDLGAEASGKLAYQIETLDGRVSQVFETVAKPQADGGFAARVQHEIALQRDPGEAADFARVAFSAPPEPVAEPEPGFFERLFGSARDRDPNQGLSKQSFRVKVVAPNELVSAYDSPTVSCEYDQLLRIVQEQQHDGGKDRPGRDGGRDRGRDRDGRGERGGAGAAGAMN